MKRFYLIPVLFFIIGFTACSKSYVRTDSGVKTTVGDVVVEIQFLNSSIVRVLKYPADSVIDKKSLSVIKEFQKTSLSVKENDEVLTVNSETIQIHLNMKSGAIAFSGSDGQLLIKEKDNGITFTPFNDAGDSTFSVKQSFILDKDEAIYGLGEMQHGQMIQRNMEKYMVQRNIEDFVPIFQSNKGYGVYWDNYSPTTFKDNEQETSFDSEVGDCCDYYFMYGGNADGVIAQMRDLTGQVPMFPLWTYGYLQSKERYKSQEEIVGVVKKYRELGVPLDGIIQDWQYWGDNDHWNAMEFLNPAFPEPEKMINDIHQLNAHIMISCWASFGPKTEQFKIMEQKGMLLDFKTWPPLNTNEWPTPADAHESGVKPYDVYNPEALKIYWEYLNKGIFSKGMDGWWLDSTEPDHLDESPTDFDIPTYLGSFRKVRNAFPLMTVGGVYDNQRSTMSEKRVFILTRSAFAGQQRYGANTWSGDIISSWENLRKQIPAGLNFSLCGIPYWNTDIGGFFLWQYRNKLKDADYRELYVRWMQFGTFCPMMRSHGTDAPREIYQFGKKGDRHYDAIEKCINLRYRFLPYIYSTSWDVTNNQSSMMRALMMDFVNDNKVLNIDDQYMFGKSLLVCPVTTPMYVKKVGEGKDAFPVEDFGSIKSKEIYIPAGTDWIDFWTGETLKGGQTISKETPFDIIPLYVKAGSIIPFGPEVQYATEKEWDNLQIYIYPGANGEFVLYEDENDNYNYENGAYSTIAFKWDNEGKTLTIGDCKGSFKGMLKERKFNIVLVDENVGAGTDAVIPLKTINYSGKQVIENFL